MSTLQESDAVLQTKTAQSLGAIGDRRAVPALIRLLGRRQGQTNHKLCDCAALPTTGTLPKATDL